MAQRQWRSDDTDTWLDKFGSGSAGTYTTSGSLTDSSRTGYSNTTFTGTSGQTSGTAGAVGNFAAGDLILIHQTRIASGAGVWELNKISSVGGGTNWTLAYALTNTYANYAQVYRLIQYSAVTIDSGHTLTGVAWDGTTGGIVAFICNGDITVTGNITTTAKGFRGGAGNTGATAYQGEGDIAAGGTQSANANGNGGGGGAISGNPSYGGGAVGNAGLTIMDLGGGGGGSVGNVVGVTGAVGAGIIVLIGKTITITGTVVADGTTGNYETNKGASGAGAGGSILLKGKTLTLGANKLSAARGAARTSTDGVGRGGSGGGNGEAGEGGAPESAGGYGGVGRIHADYSGSYSYTSSTPTVDFTQDLTITDAKPGVFYYNQL